MIPYAIDIEYIETTKINEQELVFEFSKDFFKKY